MLLAVVAVALGAATGLLAGRRTGPALATSPRRMDPALLTAGLAASGCSRLPVGGAAPALAVAGYGLLAVLAGRFRHHPGMVMVASGMLSNLAVILADAGMPVATMDPGAVSGLHHGLTSADHLTALADVISVPLLGLSASPGDVVVSVGIAVAAFAWFATPHGDAGGAPGGPDRAPASR